jgi:hypothetical protein
VASGLFEKKQATGTWRDHSLSRVIASILLVQTAYTLRSGHVGWVEDSLDHGTQATYGVLLIVLLSKWLREVGSAEDNGS